MVIGSSWMQEGGLLAAGASTCIKTVLRRSRRTGVIWQQILQNGTQTLLEALGSLRALPRRIRRQLLAATTAKMTNGFLSYRQDPSGTPRHHSVIPPGQLLAHPNHRSTASHVSLKPKLHKYPRSFHGFQAISQASHRLVHQTTLSIGEILPPVRTQISFLFTRHITNTLKPH